MGTVAVTAVGMFAGGGGFGITSLSLMSLEVIVGGMSQRPRVIDGQVMVRDVLDLTVVIDHNVVDGAPAARFAAEFRELLESAAVMSPSSVALPAPGWSTGRSVLTPATRQNAARGASAPLARIRGIQPDATKRS